MQAAYIADLEARLAIAEASVASNGLQRVVNGGFWRDCVQAAEQRVETAQAEVAAAEQRAAAAEKRADEAEWDSLMVELGMMPPPGYDAGFAAGVEAGVAQERERLRQHIGSRLRPVMAMRDAALLANIQQETAERVGSLTALVNEQAQQLARVTRELRRVTRSRSRTRSPVGQ